MVGLLRDSSFTFMDPYFIHSPFRSTKNGINTGCQQNFHIYFHPRSRSGRLVYLVLLLSSSKSLKGRELTEYMSLSICSVIFAWWMVHTVFTFRYAHVFYQKSSKNKFTGGLEFPEEPEPDYLDFAYFSFVVGMTFQVSDIQITSKNLRRLCLLHGLVSFIFNTVIIALTISVISNFI